jgi:DNA-binding NarL/FixJ family response regulator
MDQQRVLLIDDHPLFCAGLCATLASAGSEFAVIGVVADGQEGLRLARRAEPTVVLLNAGLKGFAGLQVLRELKHQLPGTGFVVLSNTHEEESLFYAVKGGAAAYLVKTATADEVLTTLRRVTRGEYLINEHLFSTPRVAEQVLNVFREIDAAPVDVAPLFSPLSPREVAVLEQIARGQSNKQIARTLTISDQTVKNHITSVLRKLAVNDRTEAVVDALRAGWIAFPEKQSQRTAAASSGEEPGLVLSAQGAGKAAVAT